MPIVIYKENEHLSGAQKFANQAMKNFISKTKDNTEPKFEALREMMKGNLYFTDIRVAINPTSQKISERSNQYDIVGFKKNGDPVAFTVLCDGTMQVKGFKQTELSKMSQNTQEMASLIHKDLTKEAQPPSLTM